MKIISFIFYTALVWSVLNASMSVALYVLTWSHSPSYFRCTAAMSFECAAFIASALAIKAFTAAVFSFTFWFAAEFFASSASLSSRIVRSCAALCSSRNSPYIFVNKIHFHLL